MLFFNVIIMFYNVFFMNFGELLLKNLLENYIALIVLSLFGQVPRKQKMHNTLGSFHIDNRSM